METVSTPKQPQDPEHERPLKPRALDSVRHDLEHWQDDERWSTIDDARRFWQQELDVRDRYITWLERTEPSASSIPLSIQRQERDELYAFGQALFQVEASSSWELPPDENKAA